MAEIDAGSSEDLKPGKVKGVGSYAVGNVDGKLFAVSRKCRHMGGDLGAGFIDDEGHLVCPRHQARYDVTTGQMVSGPRGIYARVPGLGAFYKALTTVIPLRRAKVEESQGRVIVTPD